MKLRNWIEQETGKQMAFNLVCVGSKGGRKIYAITWTDGTEEDYYIDFDRKTIEKY